MIPKELPSTWVWSTVGELLADRPSNGLSIKGSEEPPGVPALKLSAMGESGFDYAKVRYLPLETADVSDLGVRQGDFFVARGNGSLHLVGRGTVAQSPPFEVIYPDTMIRLRFLPMVRETRWVYSIWSSSQVRRQLEKKAKTTAGIWKLSQPDITSVMIPVPPIEEQGRIVAAIEQHLSGIDAGVASLKRVLANLKRYRASVLKAACEGRLVPTEAELARKEGRDDEPAEVLLRRILQERRERWEADQLAKTKVKGQVPRDDRWRAKYEEPREPETNGLPALPEGWVWCTLAALLADIEAGTSFKCDERQPGAGEVGVIKVSAVTWGIYDEAEAKTCMDPERVEPSLYVEPGDFLFSRANTIELVGACVIAERVTKRLMLSDKILRFRFAGGMPRWILYTLRSRHGRDEIERLATGNQESMRNIGQDRIRQIRVPLPPFPEQHRIVAEVDRLLSVADETEQAVRAQLARAERLRQAVLKNAFEGKLVPQDPQDEPASVLLERLRGGRAAEPATNDSAKTSRKGRAKVLRRAVKGETRGG